MSSPARPLNILDLRDTYEIGGPGKTILETWKAIDPARFRLHLGVFLASGEAETSPFIDAARQAGMPVHLIRGRNQYDLRMVGQVARLVRSLGIDVLHAHEVKSDVITCLARMLQPVPTVTTMHGWIGNGSKQRAMIALDKWVARRFDRVIAVSEPIRDALLASGVPAARIVLLHNGIVLSRYARTGRRGLLAALAGRAIEGPVVTSIGRLSPEKGHLDLVDALATVRTAGHPITAFLVGDGPARPAIEARIRALGLEQSVLLPGYLDQPQRVLEETDLMVLPSHTEGLPNVVLESLMMDVPVLATRVGGTPEILVDGVNGRMVPPHAPASLAQGILEFLEAPEQWRAMARAGRAVVERQFDFTQRTRRLEALYEEVAADRVGRSGSHASGGRAA